MREAFGNTASLASLVFCFSISIKTGGFDHLKWHKIIHSIAIFTNILTALANFYFFILSFNDYFELKENIDYIQFYLDKKNPHSISDNDNE